MTVHSRQQHQRMRQQDDACAYSSVEDQSIYISSLGVSDMAMPLRLLKEPKETRDGQCLVALNLPSRFTKHLTSCVDTFFFRVNYALNQCLFQNENINTNLKPDKMDMLLRRHESFLSRNMEMIQPSFSTLFFCFSFFFFLLLLFFSHGISRQLQHRCIS